MTDGTPQDIDAKMPTMSEKASMHADTNRPDAIACLETDEAASAHARTSQERMSASGRSLSPRWLRIVSIIWAGQAVSIVTSGASGWAIIWHVTQTEQSALMLSLLMMSSMLPLGLLSPLGGVVADRFNRKAVMIVADLGAGASSLMLALLVVAGTRSFALICLFATIRSVFSAFHAPAMAAAMPMLVPERHLLRINTLDQLLESISSICAPAVGIALYTAFGLAPTLIIEFIGALIACSALGLVKIPTVKVEEESTVAEQMRVGWDALRVHKGLVMLLGGLTVGLMAFAALGAIYPLMATQHFGADGTMVSVAEAISGTCMLVGSIVIMAWGGGRRLALLLCASAVLIAVPIIAAGLLPSTAFWIYAGLMGLASVFMAWFNGPLMTLIQQRVPEEKTGRAMGFFYALIGLAMPTGIAVGGVIAEWIGIPTFFVASGILFLVIGLSGYLFKDIRALDAPSQASKASL